MICFFKQKTAYDMRISDWSSDVCSSDLVDVEGRPAFAATIMNPGGNYNAAFQVNTVVLDRKTGTLIHRFGQNGQELESGTIHSTREDSGPVIRRQTFEDPRR